MLVSALAPVPARAHNRPMPQAPHLLEMISKLIAEPSVSSVSPTLDMGNRAVIDLLALWLDDLGYTVEILPLPARKNKANLIATRGGGEEGLVLSGHTDTVPYDDGAWHYDPFTLTEYEGRLYGLGTADMKSFLPIAIHAAAQFATKDLQRPITILATADEESTMAGAKLLENEGRRLGRHCVIGEPTSLKPVRQHKGAMMEAIRLVGQSGHASDPRLGNSALEGMADVMRELIAYREELAARHRDPAFDVPGPTLNLGHIHGGDNPNRICGECELSIDIRVLPGMDIDELREDLRRRVAVVAERRSVTQPPTATSNGFLLPTPPAAAESVSLSISL
ncbi:MAG: acetylornithine deacetylase, partial [Gammaproteobacteria bacterium]